MMSAAMVEVNIMVPHLKSLYAGRSVVPSRMEPYLLFIATYSAHATLPMARMG